jgi:hypothetical protein
MVVCLMITNYRQCFNFWNDVMWFIPVLNRFDLLPKILHMSYDISIDLIDKIENLQYIDDKKICDDLNKLLELIISCNPEIIRERCPNCWWHGEVMRPNGKELCYWCQDNETEDKGEDIPW